MIFPQLQAYTCTYSYISLSKASACMSWLQVGLQHVYDQIHVSCMSLICVPHVLRMCPACRRLGYSMCPAGRHIVAIAMQVEPSQGAWSDDTAANTFAGLCSDGTVLTHTTTNFGSWSAWVSKQQQQCVARLSQCICAARGRCWERCW